VTADTLAPAVLISSNVRETIQSGLEQSLLEQGRRVEHGAHRIDAIEGIMDPPSVLHEVRELFMHCWHLLWRHVNEWHDDSARHEVDRDHAELELAQVFVREPDGDYLRNMAPAESVIVCMIMIINPYITRSSSQPQLHIKRLERARREEVALYLAITL
jgi:hypothetical protein